jgi:heterodisulfide reductase subunit A
MDITESCAAASAAAVKASALLTRGYIELDPFVAMVDPGLCTGGVDCDAVCVEECRNLHAISLVDMQVGARKVKLAEVNTALCKGCGMCVAVCPPEAIHVAGWKMNQFDAMVDAIVADVA